MGESSVQFRVQFDTTEVMTPFSFRKEPPEVILDKAPLKRVICQIRFSRCPEIVDDIHEQRLAERLTHLYPVRETLKGLTLALPISPATLEEEPETLRTFQDIEGIWKVVVAPDFVAIETTDYLNRSDFVKRAKEALHAVASVAKPPLVTRIGVRYIDQLPRHELLPEWINPALLGYIGKVEEGNAEVLNQVITTQLRNSDDGTTVQIRSLILPKGAQFDPSIPPETYESWVLDLDSTVEGRLAFDSDELATRVNALAHDAYRVFHWAVTDQFRTHFGAGRR